MNAVKFPNGFFRLAAALCLMVALGFSANTVGLKPGKAELKSAGPLAFGPDGKTLITRDAKATVVWDIGRFVN